MAASSSTAERSKQARMWVCADRDRDADVPVAMATRWCRALLARMSASMPVSIQAESPPAGASHFQSGRWVRMRWVRVVAECLRACRRWEMRVSYRASICRAMSCEGTLVPWSVRARWVMVVFMVVGSARIQPTRRPPQATLLVLSMVMTVGSPAPRGERRRSCAGEDEIGDGVVLDGGYSQTVQLGGQRGELGASSYSSGGAVDGRDEQYGPGTAGGEESGELVGGVVDQVHGYRACLQASCLEEVEDSDVGGILDGHDISSSGEGPERQIEGVLGSVGHVDLLGAGGDTESLVALGERIAQQRVGPLVRSRGRARPRPVRPRRCSHRRAATPQAGPRRPG